MRSQDPTPTHEQVEIARWTASLGAITAEALALRLDTTVASARARLAAIQRRGLLSRNRPLAGRPSLFTLTRAGLRACGSRGIRRCEVSASNANHLIACAAVAATLERCYRGHRVVGELELRRDEREQGHSLASARLGALEGGSRMHRPDLVLFPDDPRDGLPVAVEVELTVKAYRRLVTICRGWSRCRAVAGVLYLAPPEVERTLLRAVAESRAGERIAVVPLEALPEIDAGADGRAVAVKGRAVA
jgi:Replication-relaxation